MSDKPVGDHPASEKLENDNLVREHLMPSQSDGGEGEGLPIRPNAWARVDHLTRLFYLESCRSNLQGVASSWIEKEAALRGHAPDSEAGAESWFLGPLGVARTLRYLEHGLQSGGRPLVPSTRLRIDGRSICRVFPFGFHEGLAFWGYQGHVWSVGTELQGNDFRVARDETRGPALVLGASNVSSIVATDVLCKLFCENRPVVCLIPHRLAPLMPVFKELFYPLIRDRHLHFVVGGAREGGELLADPIFETVHLTGAVETFEKIVAENTFPDRTFTAELGCVTPLIIVPGAWKAKELAYQARHLVSLLTVNGGYNCVTPQVVMVARDWAQKDEFREAVRRELGRASHRDDLFPGADEKREEWRALYPRGERFGPRTLVDVDHEAEERLFSSEAFCGMVGWLEMPASSPGDFLDQATLFCNTRLWGDLSCNIWIDPITHRDSEHALARALTDLEYGTVGVNVYTGVGFVSSVTPWGSYRGGGTTAGTGWVHNTFFFDRPEKSVIEGPFIPHVPPPWLKPFPKLSAVGRALLDLDLEPGNVNFLRLVRAYGRSLLARPVSKKR